MICHVPKECADKADAKEWFRFVIVNNNLGHYYESFFICGFCKPTPFFHEAFLFGSVYILTVFSGVMKSVEATQVGDVEEGEKGTFIR